MTQNLQQILDDAKIKNIKRKRKKKIFTACAAIVVFCTTYALIIPAITWEKTLVCQIPEHQHTASCYQQIKEKIRGNLICEQSEHMHSATCYEPIETLICQIPETEGHKHTDSCFTTVSELICGQEESIGHIHNEACYIYEPVQTCTNTEEGHVHDDSCYGTEQHLICQLTEQNGHMHTPECYQVTNHLTCGLEETEGHIHSPECYKTDASLICTISEHTHNDECYEILGEEQKIILTCKSEEHEHTEACFDAPPKEEEGYYCGKISHTHSELCYFQDGTLRCTIPEHVHTLSCESNPNAPVETREYWESTFSHIQLTGNWAQDVLSIARSQIGYTESTDNFIVENDQKYGYTRYGDWYGYPHSDWCAMFCAFCINYADITGFPIEHRCGVWTELLYQNQLYRSAWNYFPKCGDLIFFDWDEVTSEARYADHVGFISEYITDSEGNVTGFLTIEGNWANSVCTNSYDISDPRIIGYGIMPENPRLQKEQIQEKASETTGDDIVESDQRTVVEQETTGTELESEDIEHQITETKDQEETPEITSDPKATKESEQSEQDAAEDKKTYCNLQEHVHNELCFSASGHLRCELTEHKHSEECYLMPDGYVEPTPAPSEQKIISAPAADGAVAVISGVLPYGATATIEAVTFTEEERIAYFGEKQAAAMTSFVAYDIKIMVNGEEWQPDASVSVTVEHPKIEVGTGENFAAAHIDSQTNQVTEVNAQISDDGTVAVNTGTEEKTESVSVSFEAEGFSIYCFYTFTVDFHYGEVTFSIYGRSEILLSELFSELGITRTVSDVISVWFTDETLVTITRIDGDWLLTSLNPFLTEETLTIGFADGETYIIGVTDANTILPEIQSVTGTWNTATHRIATITANAVTEGIFKDKLYDLRYRNTSSDSWTFCEVGIKAANNNEALSLNIQDEDRIAMYLTSLESELQICQYKIDKNVPKAEQSADGVVTVYDILNGIKPGFTEWLGTEYLNKYQDAKAPETLDELYSAFALYYNLPLAKLDKAINGRELNIVVTVTTSDNQPLPCENYTYIWQYQKDTGEWEEFPGETGAVLNVSQYAETLLDKGKNVRCEVRSNPQDETAPEKLTYSDVIFADPTQDLYNQVIDEINAANVLTKQLNSDEYKQGYFNNVVQDPNGPIRDNYSPEEDGWKIFSNYLAEIYLTQGITEVQNKWNYYYYDIYDPSNSLSNISYTPYPTVTYGDNRLEWPKDSATSFHADVTPNIIDLNYNFLENGIDYSNFITNLTKSAHAVAAGDNNTERKYNIHLVTDAQAKVAAPVAMILQIQTSWQMFDMLHANAKKGEGQTEKGAVANNDALGTLYEIKHALLRFIDYMETKYPGNNLVLGITETQHAGSSSMLNGTKTANIIKRDNKGNIVYENGKPVYIQQTVPVYVSNDYNVLRQGILGWDTFGNCEHVHYDTDTLSAAVSNLEGDLAGWMDFYKNPIMYDDIEKVAVIIGGPTENDASTNGYACELPWSTFADKKIDAVYGIRTNTGSPYSAPVISWIDYSTNIDQYDGLYVSTTENEIYNSLISIAQNEIGKKGIKLMAEDKYVDNVYVYDTVQKEFLVDPNKPFVATVFDKKVDPDDGTETYSEAFRYEINWKTGQINYISADENVSFKGHKSVSKDSEDNKITEIYFSFNQPYHYTINLAVTEGRFENAQKLTIKENQDGTTEIIFDYGRVYNTKQCTLDFGIVAKNDYIGSNSAYTNVGYPYLEYTHKKIDATGQETGIVDLYSRNGRDTPQVNVPVIFNATDGEEIKVILNSTVDIGEEEKLFASRIVKQLEDIVEIYPQINGTISYKWLMPDGSEYECGSVKVINGVVQDDKTFPSILHTYQVTQSGKQEFILQATFEPDAISSTKNYDDDTTAVPVSKLTKQGSVWIEAVGDGTTRKYHLRKVWTDDNPGNIEQVSVILCDGHDGYITGTNNVWSITDDKDKATQFIITAANNWELVVESLPTVKLVEGNTVILNYGLEECEIPTGYTANYREYDETVKTYDGKASVTIINNTTQDINDIVRTKITFAYGDNQTTVLTSDSITKTKFLKNGGSLQFTFSGIPLDINDQIYNNIIVSSVTIINKDGKETTNSNFTGQITSAYPQETGKTVTPIYEVQNRPEGTEITIRKIVDNGDQNKTYNFTAILETGSFITNTEKEDEKLTVRYSDDNKTADFALAHNEEVTFIIPAGTNITVFEQEHSGYYTYIKKIKNTGNNESEAGKENSDILIFNADDGYNIIEFHNAAGEGLPETGGIGTKPIYTFGVLLIAGALVCGFILRRKERKKGK